MSDRSSDLETFRDAFLHELTASEPDVSRYQEFLQYWKTVEAEAAQTEELGQLEEWAREIARDKDRVATLKTHAETAAGDKSDVTAQTLRHILKLVLDMLETIERRLRRLRNERRSVLAAVLWKGGPGTFAKPAPPDDKDNKGEKKAGDAGAAAVPVIPGPVVKPPVVKPEKEKKLER